MKKEEKYEMEQLFQRLKTGDRHAVEELYNKHNKTVYGIAFSILKNKEDAEDAVQTVFSKLWTLEKEKLPQNKEGTWLYTVTKNEALSILKKKNCTIDLSTVYDLEDKDNELENIINKENYNKLISKLGNKEKEIVSLKIVAGLSFEEISKLLGEKTGTVKWRYYKSLYRIKALLSNFAMFILTFVIGVHQRKRKIANAEMSETQDKEEITSGSENDNKEEITNGSKEDNDTTSNLESSGNLKDETNEENTNDILEEEKQENTIVEDIPSQPTDYMQNGFFTVSFIFLILTIIFTIFFKKYQLKSKKKSSK